VIGGTRQENDTDTVIRPADSNDVWQRACKYIPSLKGAEWQSEWAGLRPVREPIRIEAEIMKFGDKSLQVVHNYGHGGNGVSLAWGTSKHAVDLVSQLIQSSTKAKL